MAATKKLIVGGLIISLLSTNSCGYFLYPERVGQSKGKIDSTVVILDVLGLFIGVIPGVVAFAVDFTTGTIYLPPGEKSAVEKHGDRISLLNDLQLESVSPTDLPIDPEFTARQLSEKLGIVVDPKLIEFYQVKSANSQIALVALP